MDAAKHYRLMQVFAKMLLLGGIMGMQGCSRDSLAPGMYRPHPVNAPLLNDDNHACASVVIGTQGLAAQGAYGFKSGLALMGAYNQGISYTKEHAVDLAGGYYKDLDGAYSLECFGGIGLGRRHDDVTINYSSEIFYSSVNYIYDYKYIRPFIQADIGYRDDLGNIIFSSRFSWQSYIHFVNTDIFANSDSSAVQNNGPQVYSYHYYKSHKPLSTFEPALTMQGGGESMFRPFFLQVGFCIPLSRDFASYPYPRTAFPVFLNIGCNFKF